MKKKQTLALTMIVMAFMILLVADLLLWFFLGYSRVSPPRLPTAPFSFPGYRHLNIPCEKGLSPLPENPPAPTESLLPDHSTKKRH